MLIALIATAARCATPDYCPSDAELLAAIRRRDDDVVVQTGIALRAENPDEFITVHSERILRVRDVHCEEALNGDLRTVNCTYTVTYPSTTVREVAKLSRDSQEWVIAESMRVTLSRRNER